MVGSGVARTVEEMEQFHRKNQRRDGRTFRINKSERLWVSQALLKRYWNREKKKVGTAKASLAKGAVRLNPKIKVPAWVRRNFSKVVTSGAGMRKVNGAPTAIIKAEAEGLQRINRGTMNMVMRGRLKAMEKRLMFIFKKSAKKSGFKVR